MANLSASDLAFTGFRIVRERPKVVATWAVLRFVLIMGISLFMVATAGSALAQFQAISRQVPANPAATIGLFRRLAPTYSLLMILGLVVQPVVLAAMNRAVIRPEPVGFAYLRFGNEEFLQFVLMVLIFVLAVGLYIGLIIAGVVIGLIVGIAGKSALPLVIVLMVVGALAGAIYLAVRLSLASAITFDTGRVSLFSSWTLTRGRFWAMFGTYLLTLALLLVLAMIAMVVIVPIVFLGAGGLSGLGHAVKPDMSSIGLFLTPALVVFQLLWAVFSAVAGTVWLTVPAGIYRELRAQGA